MITMGTIIVITTVERDKRTGRKSPVVSHGIDAGSNNSVPLPCAPPEQLGAVFDPELGEYTLTNEPAPRERVR